MTFSKILIDVPNLFIRNHYTHQGMFYEKDGNKIPTGGIYGFIKSLQKIQKNYGSEITEYYFLYDNFASKTISRKEIDPGYKIDREKFDSSIYQEINVLALILMSYSEKFFNCQVPSMEADDLPLVLIKGFDKYDNILVVSEDLDYSRCITNNVYWLNKNTVFDKITFKDKYGFSPSRESVVLYKCFRGDDSDNIPAGVKGIREDTLIPIVEKGYSDIYHLIENVNKDEVLFKVKDKIVENKSRLVLNYQLIDFIEVEFSEIEQYIFKGIYSPSALRSFYKGLGFKIPDIDDRLMNSFPEASERSLGSADNEFFNFEKIQRV
jgi:5'-3' exonuclease